MSEWSAIGELYDGGAPARAEWSAGRLTGSPGLLAAVEEYAANHVDVPVTPTGPFVPIDRTDELCGYLLVLAVMRSVDVTGEPPVVPLPELPAGAVA